MAGDLDLYLDKIVQCIEQDRCVLMLGPYVALNNVGIPIQKDLPRFFKEERKLKIKQVTDNLIIFEDRHSEEFWYLGLTEYYEDNQKFTDIHRKLAQIPAHLFISISPDLLLKRCFDEFGMNYNFQFYNRREEERQDVKRPTKSHPLFYNLFGSIEKEESLIMTHDHLFDFLEKVLGEQPLPRTLQETYQAATAFVFIGFDFEQWYVKLILRLFKLKKSAEETYPYAAERVEGKTKIFYKHNFGMTFLDTTINDFVNKLYQRFEKKESLREIREKEVAENSLKAKVKGLIKQNQLQDALDALDGHFKGKDLHNLVVHQWGRFNSLTNKIEKGIISGVDETTETNQIRESLQDIADQI